MSSEKTIENIRKRCNVYLETDPDHLLRQTAKPTYVSCKIFYENLVAVNMKLERLKLDKPSYVRKYTAKVGQDNVNIGVVTIFRLANTSLLQAY